MELQLWFDKNGIRKPALEVIILILTNYLKQLSTFSWIDL